VNSSNSDGFDMSGGATLQLTSPAKVGVYGGWNISGQSVLDLNGNPTSPVKLASRVTDPLAALPAPSAGPLRSTQNVNYDQNHVPANNTLQPGVYCGGLSVNNTQGVAFKMATGTYIMAGGGIKFQSQAIVDATAGVTIYNTSANASHMWGCPSTSNYTPVSISGQATLTMKAPVSGTYTGIAFFEDRDTSVTGSNPGASQNTISGGASAAIDGALYFKNTELIFSGCNSASGYLVLVADIVQITGGSTFGNNYSSLSNSNYFAPQSTGGGLVE
jgi:hypothetical protein